MTFWDGLDHAIYHRVVSQSWDHWKRDWQWMGGYFTGGVWSCLLMATGIRGTEFEDKKSSKKSGVSPDEKSDKKNN